MIGRGQENPSRIVIHNHKLEVVEIAPPADKRWMEYALSLAERARAAGEVPVGAVLVYGGDVWGEGWNRPIQTHDPTAHAEIVALRDAAGRRANYRLPGTTLYTTLEPCPMCAGALVQARVARLVYGAADPRAGSAGTVFDLVTRPELNHRVAVTGGVLADACGAPLKAFFAEKRQAGT